MTCPVCGQPMSELNAHGQPRTTCSARCALELNRPTGSHAHLEVEFLLDAGESPELIAQRFGIQPASVARALYRAGRHDLALPFERVRNATRYDRSA